MKYRKKPIVIEAIMFNGHNSSEIACWSEGAAYVRGIMLPAEEREMEISTLDGTMRANCGDYIIKGIKGEFYPCKPDIFEATYEKVES